MIYTILCPKTEFLQPLSWVQKDRMIFTKQAKLLDLVNTMIQVKILPKTLKALLSSKDLMTISIPRVPVQVTTMLVMHLSNLLLNLTRFHKVKDRA